MQWDSPQAERQNDKGICWTCLDKNRSCDGDLPRTLARDVETLHQASEIADKRPSAQVVGPAYKET